MIDDLDLSFEEDYDRGRHRRGRRGARKPNAKAVRKRRRGRSFFALFLTLVLLGVLGGAGWYGFGKVQDYLAVKDFKGAGTGTVTVQVASGDGGTDIGNKLVTQGVVRSSQAFINAYTANPHSKDVEPGFYNLRKQMKASLAVDMLLARKADGSLANRVSNKITITEGMISQQIFETLSKATKIPVAQFTEAAKNPIALGIPDWWFTRQDGHPQPNPPSIEGFLYPATYDFDPNADAAGILKTMVQNFLTVTGDLKFADDAQQKGISPYEGLIAASIAQVEAVFPQDMGGVVRVLYNRAYKGFDCGCLGLDSTVNYWLRITGKAAQQSGSISYSMMHDPKNPYNTYDNKGLPPGPISNPGKDALTAAINAPASNYTYFLAIDKAGHTAFASTYSDFCAKTHQAKNNGVSIGTC